MFARLFCRTNPSPVGRRRHGAFMGCHAFTRKGVTMKTIVCLLLTALLVIFTFTPTTFVQDVPYTVLDGQTGPVFSVSFSADGQTLASGSRNNTVVLWDVSTGRNIRTLLGHTLDEICSVSFNADGQMLASVGGKDNTIRLWEVSTGTETTKLTGHTDVVWSVSFIPFLNNKFSLTKNAFVVAQFIAPLTFTFVRSSNSH